VVYGETRQTQARRWAKFPATVLFVLSVLWLLRSFFSFGDDPAHFQELTHTGVGILQVLWDLLVIPVGGAVIGIYLLLRKRWAAPASALLPLEPLLVTSARKLVDVTANFHDYNTRSQMNKLYEGLVDLIVLLGFWVLFGLMCFYLYKVWELLKPPAKWGPGVGATVDVATPMNAKASANGDSEVCFLLPEGEDVEA
jgi:hypothetical protein